VGPEEGAALHVEDAALVVVLELLEMVDGELVPLGGLLVQGWTKPGFLNIKNPAQWVFGVLGFFWVLVFLYICPEERVFRVFSVSRILLSASRL
jgi:hypothetical protein